MIAHQEQHNDGRMYYDLFVIHKRVNKHDALIDLEHVMAVGDGRNDEVLIDAAISLDYATGHLVS